MTTARTLPPLKKGDRLILVTNNRYFGDLPVEVSRVGRDYVYVSDQGNERRERFHKATGVEDQQGLRAVLLTPEQYEESKLRESLLYRLREAGVTVRSDVEFTLPTSKIEALLALLEADAN